MSKEKIQELKNRIEGVKANAASHKLGCQRFIATVQSRLKSPNASPQMKTSARNEITQKKSEMQRYADTYKREIESLKASIAKLK